MAIVDTIELAYHSIENLAQGTKSEPVVAVYWQEAIRMAIAGLTDIGDETIAAKDLILALLPRPDMSADAKRARVVFAIQCLVEDPRVSQDCVTAVLDWLPEIARRYDGVNNSENTQLDIALGLLRRSRWGEILEARLLDLYEATVNEQRHRIGCLYATSLANQSHADLLSGHTLEEYCSLALQEGSRYRLESLLILTQLFYSLSSAKQPREQSRAYDDLVVACLADDSAVATAACWSLMWWSGAKSPLYMSHQAISGPVSSALKKLANDFEIAVGGDIALVLSLDTDSEAVTLQEQWIYKWALVADGQERQESAGSYTRPEGEETVSLLEKLFHIQSGVRDRAYVALGLGRMGRFTSESIEALGDILFDSMSDSEQRDECVICLGLSKLPKASDILKQLFKTEDLAGQDYNKVKSVLALVGLGDADALHWLLQQEDEMGLGHRKAAAHALASMAGPRGYELLESCAHHPQAEIREAAATAIEKWPRDGSGDAATS